MGDETALRLCKQAVRHGMAQESSQVEHGDFQAVVELDNFGCELFVRNHALKRDSLVHLEFPYCLEGKVVHALGGESVTPRCSHVITLTSQARYRKLSFGPTEMSWSSLVRATSSNRALKAS